MMSATTLYAQYQGGVVGLAWEDLSDTEKAKWERLALYVEVAIDVAVDDLENALLVRKPIGD
jgi:hypothetical protein